MQEENWHKIIFEEAADNFETVALKIFRYQYEMVEVYQKYCHLLKKKPSNVNTLSAIPFLPISFFKSQTVIRDKCEPQKIFESSTTTGSTPSKHYLADLSIYEKSATDFFLKNYPTLPHSALFALLPHYIERGNSSLVYMTNHLLQYAKRGDFFLYDFDKLYREILNSHSRNEPIILIGVAYALYDFAAQYRLPDDVSITVLETGGMKGRKEEITRAALHHYLREKLNVGTIHAEYGMTELLSQAYCCDGEYFKPAPWMRFLIRDLQDPFTFLPQQQTGGINIIDLANVHSCSFIETEDMGKLNNRGEAAILGRIENTATRGCNLLYIQPQ